MSEVDLVVARTRLEKAAATGAVMDLQERITFFSDLDSLLKAHAHRKHATLTPEQAFVREMANDETFRVLVRKTQQLQEQLNSSG